MRLLYITEFFPSDLDLKFTGGVEARTFFIAKNLAKKEKVVVICRKTKNLTRQKRLANILIYPVGLATSNVEANFLSVFERIIFIFTAFFKGLRLEFDLVEGSNFVAYLPAFFLGFLKKKPFVSWWPDVLGKEWIKNFGLTGVFGQIIEKICLRLPWTKVIALSKSTKDKLIKAGVDKNKIEVVYGGVDYKKLKIKNEKLKTKNILCISRLVRYKRVDDLIKAFGKLVRRYPEITLTIVGRGSEEKKLKKLVGEKELAKKVIFLKNLPRSKLIMFLKQAYIFCLPSIVEGFGLVTIEAAACQTPYVISDIEVNKEITQDGQGGLFFKQGNVEDLQEKLQSLLENKKLYLQKQKQGPILAKNYDWQKIASQTKKIYSEI